MSSVQYEILMTKETFHFVPINGTKYKSVIYVISACDNEFVLNKQYAEILSLTENSKNKYILTRILICNDTYIKITMVYIIIIVGYSLNAYKLSSCRMKHWNW